MFKNKKNIKNNIIFLRRLDYAYTSAIVVFLIGMASNFFSPVIVLAWMACLIGILVMFYFTSFPCVTKIKVQTLKVHNNLLEISAALHENGLMLQNKVGDFYIFKSRNLIVPNISISVKECDTTNCIILLHTCDATWLEDSLKQQ